MARGVLLSSDDNGFSNVQIHAMAAEPDGAMLYVAGRASGSVPVGAGEVSLATEQAFAAGFDAADGTVRWVTPLGTTQLVQVAALRGGGVLVVFQLDVAVTVLGTLYAPRTGSDILAVALDTDGAQRWVRQFSQGDSDAGGRAVGTPGGGAVLVFSGASTQPDPGRQNCGLVGAVLDNTGTDLWQECLIESDETFFIPVDGLAHDATRDVFYVSGYPIGNLTYGSAQTGTPVDASVGASYLLQVVTSTPFVQWAVFFQRAYARSLYVDSQGQVVTVGHVPSMGTDQLPILVAGTVEQRCVDDPTFHTSTLSTAGELLSTRLIPQTNLFVADADFRAFVDLEQQIYLMTGTAPRWMQRVAGTTGSWQPTALKLLSAELVAAGSTAEPLTLATQTLTPPRPGTHGVIIWATL